MKVKSNIGLAFNLMIICLLTSLQMQAQARKYFTIEGNIDGLKAGSKLCMIFKKYGKIDTISRCVSSNEGFKFRNVRLPIDYPDFYMICVQTEFVENLNLYLDGANDVKIKGELKKWPNVIVAGSKTHEDFERAKKIQNKIWDEDFAVRHPKRTAYLDTILMYSIKGMYAVMDQMPDSYYLPQMLANWTFTSEKKVVPADIKKPLYDRLSLNAKDSHYGKILEKQIVDAARVPELIAKLKSGTEGLPCITTLTVLEELRNNRMVKINIERDPMLSGKLTERQLIRKLERGTLIVNLAYKPSDTALIQINATTAYVIDGRGICVTNYHVGEEYAENPYSSFSVMTVEGKSYPVIKVLSSSESDDLMVFQVDTKGDKLVTLPLGNVVTKETKIHVMGHPRGKFYQFSSGFVTGYTTSVLARKSCNIMSITADFNVGSSGGPIVDEFGNVVGTVSRIDGGGMKVGIPVSELKKLIEFKK
ncbi:trypsin-like peptidase domain-containing protein [Pedobacter frigoris]|uniref:trypsin-like peptidase domain-containing protein n=1 Tax=Pedobacter frigoris TaxID=2571272 RepID=UPI00292DE3F0|nr:trypsin-like peptidase domain-containing protein [Pedobacter frigoris]